VGARCDDWGGAGHVTPRDRRLTSDLAQMEELAARGELTFRAEGSPPETYHLLLNIPGLARDSDGTVRVRELHRCTIYLHRDYPRRPPIIVWLTPVFHPNLLPPERNGGVCIGGWSASESLADLCRRLGDMVAYRSLNLDDALDPEAAEWARRQGMKPGVDLRKLLTSQLSTNGSRYEVPAHAS
jgi:ubiquitin-protein ligase